MSRAFVRERDDAPADELPEIQLSGRANLVTPRGLRLMEQKLFELNEALDAGRGADGKARILRDLRYWTARRASAQLVDRPASDSEVGFGSEVVIRRQGNPPETFQIVGEDEADPARGRISYVSPIAQALMGARAGETVAVENRKPSLELEVVAVQ